MAEDRILIIDDQVAFAELVANVARNCGYEAEHTTNADVFLKRVEDWNPTHIVIDLNMPVVDGVEMLRHLAARKTRAQIVIMSGLDGKVVESARRLGGERGLDVAGMLLKPFSATELLELLERLKAETTWCTEAGLAAALERGDLFLVYLPKVELQSTGIASFEALVRWQHPKHGVISPAKFLPLAENGWLIERLTDMVLDTALRQLRDWGEAVTSKVAVNLSGKSLHDETLPDRLLERCAAFGIVPDRLELELSETSAMADPALTMDILTRLRLKGFHVVLDDFGTGRSSLIHLARLPFSEIKIDRSFVTDCAASRESLVIVKSIIDLAHNLNLNAVAEGVESAELYRLAHELGCDMAQGYHIAKPLTAEQVPSWVGEWRERRKGINLVDNLPERPVSPPRRPAPVWNKAWDGSADQQSALAQVLSERIHPLWGLGRNSLVGWRPLNDGIEVLIMPYRRIVDHFGQSRRLLRGKRLMGQHTFDTARELAGCSPVRISLPFRVSDSERGAVPTNVIEHVLRRYGITETLYRAVALFDIVGFSKFEPSRQIAQLNSLECSISTAQMLMQQISRRVDLARTTTGDGFYIWNREKGAAADIDTYLLSLLALADNAIARRDGGGEFVPELRACFAIGPHYSYYQVEGLDPHGHDYIVGDVTIALARMIAKCLPGQVLIHDFLRPVDEDDEPTNPIDFMLQAEAAFERLNGAVLQDRRIDTIRCYLTGAERNPGAFDISRYTIEDKHGMEHAVFNQKFNIYLTDMRTRAPAAETIFLGKREDDLADFDAVLTPLNLVPEVEVA